MAITEGINAGFVTTQPVADPDGTAGDINECAVATRFTSPSFATSITEMAFYLASSGGATVAMKFGIYSDDAVNNRPGTILGQMNTVVLVNSGWVFSSGTFTGTKVSILPTTNYWAAVVVGSEGHVVNIDSTNSAGYVSVLLTGQTTASFTNTWSPATVTSANIKAFTMVYHNARRYSPVVIE